MNVTTNTPTLKNNATPTGLRVSRNAIVAKLAYSILSARSFLCILFVLVSMLSVSQNTNAAGTGRFYVSGAKIIGPNGAAFQPRGINLYEDQMGAANTVLSLFPGINIIRLACFNFNSPSYYQAFVNQMTAKGIVVLIEDHSNNGGNAGGSAGTIYTGALLNSELSWYSNLASAYSNNPYVWFGTNNEPSENPSAAALSTWQQQTYNAIRNTGNKNLIMVEMNCWADPNSCAAGYNASVYTSMTNVAWDMHYYGWLTNYNTNQSVVSQDLAAHASAAQRLTSADGVMPIFIGEYGDSTNGSQVDANGSQVVNAVHNSGFGATAWHYSPGAPADVLTDGNGHLTSPLGTSVAAFIRSGQGPVLPSTPAPSSCTASANKSVVTSIGPTLCDSSGNAWAIASDRSLLMNGASVQYSAGVIEIAYVNGSIWQENSSNLWWQFSAGSWTPMAGTTTNPLGQVVNPTPTPAPPPAATPKPASPGFTNGSTISLINTNSAMCIDLPSSSKASGTVLQQFACNGSSAQHFKVTKNSDGSYSFANSNSGMCIDVQWASMSNSAPVWQYTCNGSAAQKFTLVYNGSFYSLKNVNSGLCIDVPGSSKTAGIKLQQYSCNGSSAQLFKAGN
jgi:hypothetical protein